MQQRPRPVSRALATSPFVRTPEVVHTTEGFSVGDRVTLDSRGMGRVIEVTVQYVVVEFGPGERLSIPPGTRGFSLL